MNHTVKTTQPSQAVLAGGSHLTHMVCPCAERIHTHGAHWEREHCSWCLPNPSEPWISVEQELRTACLSPTGVREPLVLCHLTPRYTSHRLHTTHQKKRLLLASVAPKVAGPAPPCWTWASHSPLLWPALWEQLSGFLLFTLSHFTAIPHEPFLGMKWDRPPPARREATTATSVRSPRHSGAVTLLSVQPETEQAGAPGRRRGSG